MKKIYSKIHFWIIHIFVFAVLGCSMIYYDQLFDGTKTAKSFYFILVLSLAFIYLSVYTLLKKKSIILSFALPDIVLFLYFIWAFVRLLTSQTDSIRNMDFWILCATIIWYFFLRTIFFKQKKQQRFYFPDVYSIGIFSIVFLCFTIKRIDKFVYASFPY